MKKLLTMTLALALCLALAAPALAADEVMPSPQALVFDGYGVEDFTAYNINGYNYFKLRDIAALMNGTAGEFAVGWDEDTRTVSVTTGGSYVWVGGELEKGADLSATAVPSTQTVLIDGEKCDTLSVYNIGGNNYFRLRDLGEALGFGVDYDEEWNAAILTTPKTGHRLLSQTTTDEYGTVTLTYTYDEKGRQIGYSTDNGSSNSVCTYNDYGVVLSSKAWGGDDVTGWEMETVYNGRGDVLSDALRFSDSRDETEYTYSDKGVLLRKYAVNESEYSDTTGESLYNEQGQLVKTTDTFAGSDGAEETSVTVYSYDAQGRQVAYTTTGSGSQWSIDMDENYEWFDVLETYSYVEEGSTVYEDGRSTETVRRVYTNGDGSTSESEEITIMTYDEKGNLLSERTESSTDGDGFSFESRNTYDAAGRVLTHTEYFNDEADSVETYVYDENGHTLSDRTDYASGAYSAWSYTYDERGNCVAESYEALSYTYDWDTDEIVSMPEQSSSTYVYDAENRPVLYVSEQPGEHYERAFFYDEFGNEVKETVTINGEQTELTVFVYD